MPKILLFLTKLPRNSAFVGTLRISFSFPMALSGKSLAGKLMIWGEGYMFLNYITDLLFLNFRRFARLLGKNTEEYYTDVDVAVKLMGRVVECVLE